jgi:DNA ligase-1
MVVKEDFNQTFAQRIMPLGYDYVKDIKYLKIVKQNLLLAPEAVNTYYEEALNWGCDGLILRDPNGKYKFGRGTVKEGLIYKMKPFQTFDAKIIDVIQATEVREGAEKKINELGRSVTSKKKDDRVLIEKASAFVVLYEGKELKVTIAMTDEEKTEVWKNKEKYIGKCIEYKGMLVGAKELPRHPVFLRFREDKE